MTPANPECHDEVCVTCSDAAVPVRIVELRPGHLALADTAGEEEVSVRLVDAQAGDVVLVHAKEAIAVLEKAVTDALYPFLSSAESGAGSLLAAVARSTVEKAREIAALRRDVLTLLGPRMAACVEALTEAFATGGRLFAFGNGGSSTDAQAVAHLFLAPKGGPGNGHRGLPALSLTADVALLTALTNDIGFDAVFARQLAALGTGADIALGISTSGGSANVVRGLQEAKRLGMVTVGLAGSGGGRMAECGAVDHLLVIPSSSVHRIQEAQATVCHVLWESVRRALDGAV